MSSSPDQRKASGTASGTTFLAAAAPLRGCAAMKVAMREKDLGIWQAWSWQQVLDEGMGRWFADLLRSVLSRETSWPLSATTAQLST